MLRSHRNKLIISLGICSFFLMVSFAFQQVPSKPEARPAPKNLKILPKNIDHSALIHIMNEYCQALGYKCTNCHAASASGNGMDFASDAKPKKDTAREMMKMVEKLNKRFFKVKGAFVENFVNAKYEVSCFTCHHGSEHPMASAPPRLGPSAPPPGAPSNNPSN